MDTFGKFSIEAKTQRQRHQDKEGDISMAIVGKTMLYFLILRIDFK